MAIVEIDWISTAVAWNSQVTIAMADLGEDVRMVEICVCEICQK